MKIFAVSLLALVYSTVVTADVALPIPMRHPQEPFEPVYMRKYTISMEEAKSLPFCQSLTHDCDWGLIVLLRQESCIPRNFELVGLMQDEAALQCPLLIEGFSIYDTDNTSPDAKPHKHHITNQAGVDLPVFVFNSASYFWWEQDNNKNFTYADLVNWADMEEDVYRGVAKNFFESHSANVNGDAVDINKNFTRVDGHIYDEGDMTVIVKGVLEGKHEFSFTIDEVGDTYKPIIWDVTMTGGKAFESENDDGLEGGALAGAMIGVAIIGAVFGAACMLFMRGNKQETTATSTSAPPAMHKDIEPTEAHEPTETQA